MAPQAITPLLVPYSFENTPNSNEPRGFAIDIPLQNENKSLVSRGYKGRKPEIQFPAFAITCVLSTRLW
jgi:hypothetical protein